MDDKNDGWNGDMSEWKFIDLFKGKEKVGPVKARKRLDGLCPYPKTCYPAAYSIGDNNAGCCCGMIDNVKDLDCIRLCVWHTVVSEDRSSSGSIQPIEFFMTPVEGVDMAKIILTGVANVISLNSSYDAHRKHLHELREKSEREGHAQN